MKLKTGILLMLLLALLMAVPALSEGTEAKELTAGCAFS